MTGRQWKQFNDELDRRMDPARPYYEMVDAMINLGKDWSKTWLMVKSMLPRKSDQALADAVFSYADRRYDELRKNVGK